MLSREAYEKFMQDIQKRIDEADRSSREKAEGIIKSMTDSYNNALAERVSYEFQVAQLKARAGDLSEAERHKLRAEIYQSILGATGNAKS